MRHSTVVSRRSWLTVFVVAILAMFTLACGFEGGAFGPVPTPATTNQVLVPLVVGASPTEPPLKSVTAANDNAVERILIAAPTAGQGLRSPFHVEGLADPTLEQLSLLVRDAQGKVIAGGRLSVEAQPGQRSKFSAEVPLPADLSPQTGRVVVYAISPRDKGITHLASVEVQLKGDGKAAAPIDPATPEGIVITFPSPGADVQGTVKVAAATLLGPDIHIEVRDANDQMVGKVEKQVDVVPGQPAQVLAEVPIHVTTAQPGRVLVYTLNARDGQPEHLSSIEVNLKP